jgi:hypothetical protein
MLRRSGRPSWTSRSVWRRWDGSRRWLGPWRFLASNFSSSVRKKQIRTVKAVGGMKASYDYTYFRFGRFIVAECSGMVSRWPRRAGDGWREITLLPIPRIRPPAPRTPRGTAITGSSATTSSSATFCLLGDEDVSSSSSVRSFVRG